MRGGRRHIHLHTPGTGSRRRRAAAWRGTPGVASRRNPDGKLVVETWWSPTPRLHSVNRAEGGAEHSHVCVRKRAPRAAPATPWGARGTHPASGPAKEVPQQAPPSPNFNPGTVRSNVTKTNVGQFRRGSLLPRGRFTTIVGGLPCTYVAALCCSSSCSC